MKTSWTEPLSIELLTRMLKSVVEETFHEVYVVGEISNYTCPKSGHRYFNLKDSEAQLAAVLWKTTGSRLRFELKDGLEVYCHGRIEIYPPHGTYKLIVTSIEPKGIGALELAFRQLHEKLAQEGLFLPERKKVIPASPKRIGIITSGTGAAIRDFLNVLHRRTKRVQLLISPVSVQGEGASTEIAQAIGTLNGIRKEERPELLVLIRGGGSVEDLWTFNEETTVRAIASSKIPIVTGIGHEIDVSLSDLAADLHALTPSDAAARIVPEDREFAEKITRIRSHLDRGIARCLEIKRQVLSQWRTSPLFLDPGTKLLTRPKELSANSQERLFRAIDHLLEKRDNVIRRFAARLESLSPLAVLSRGFSLTEKENGTLLRDAAETVVGEIIRTRLEKGSLKSIVQQINKE